MKATSILKLVDKVIRRAKSRAPEEIAAALHIRVVTCYLGESTLGMCQIIKGRKFIFLSDRLDYTSTRMILAHEIGHFILHKEQIKTGLYDDCLFDQKSITEREANIAAAHILIKDSEISALLPYGYTFQQIASMLEVHVDLMCLKLRQMKKAGSEIQEISEPTTYTIFNDIRLVAERSGHYE